MDAPENTPHGMQQAASFVAGWWLGRCALNASSPWFLLLRACRTCFAAGGIYFVFFLLSGWQLWLYIKESSRTTVHRE